MTATPGSLLTLIDDPELRETVERVAAALLGVDTCAMEGFQPDKFDEILGLTGTGFTSIVACAAGYRAADDKAALRKKVRFPASEVIQRR